MLSDRGEIALSLSGGGVRALGYHLGTMDYLNRLGWLERVSILSSVSGGSMTAIGYALAKKKQLSFDQFYDQIFEFLTPLNTVEMIFEDLGAPEPVAPSGRRDLITCWADVYRQTFFEPYYGDPELDVFWSGPNTHLKEVIFNAVEMKTGVAFRFQHSDNTEAFRVGNGNIWLKHEHARMLKMSDVMASSSCIPGGMEPLQLPKDYRWPDDERNRKGIVSRKTCDEVERHLEEKFGKDAGNIAIFDGGIYDNQTISSVLLALSRAHDHGGRSNHAELEQNEPSVHDGTWHEWFDELLENYTTSADHDRLGMYIISDAVVRHDPMFEPDPDNCMPGQQKSWLRRRTLGELNVASWVISIALLVSAGVNLYDFFAAGGFGGGSSRTMIMNVVSSLIPALVAAVVLLLVFFGRRKLENATRSMLSRMPRMKRRFWSLVKGLSFGNVLDMLSVRGASLSMLVSRFYMHRTRQPEYSIVYKEEKLAKKIVANEIYRLLDPPDGFEVSEDLRTVVEVSANLPTKIWVNELGDSEDVPEILRGRNDLQALVATGQATIIANLLHHVGDAGTTLRERLERDWRLVNKHPFHFVDERP